MADYRTTTAMRHSGRADRTGVPASSRTRRPAESTARFGIAILMVFATVVAVAGPGSPAAGVDVTHFETIAVVEGDSLWRIAAEHPVPGLGTSETVDLIRSTNRLEGTLVHAGQTIRVPAQMPPGTSLASR